MASNNVVSIPTSNYEYQDKLARVNCGTVVRFVVTNSEETVQFGQFEFETNCPLEKSQLFQRDVFRKLQQDPVSKKSKYVSFTIDTQLPGAFKYRITRRHDKAVIKAGALVVEPVIKVNGETLPLEAIVMQTVLTKCMGPSAGWNEILQPVIQANYNFIHFTPVQVLGESNSCYSIYDQLRIANSVLDTNDETAKFEALTHALQQLEAEHSILSLTDIVLNHTASNTHWIQDHPEACYTSLGCPHLHAAIELEDAMFELSKELGPSPGEILNSEEKLQQIMDIFKTTVLPKYKLWEYFVLNKEIIKAKFFAEYPDFAVRSPEVSIEAIKKFCAKFLSDNDFIQNIVSKAVAASGNPKNPRNGWTLDLKVCLKLLDKKLLQLEDVMEVCWDMVSELVDLINSRLYARYERDIDTALGSIEGTARYEWLEKQPRRGSNPIPGHVLPLVDPYFSRVVFPNGDVVAYANNGFIWGGDPAFDFGSPGPLGVADPSSAYFRREIVIWGDCIKLNYGMAPEDSPWLWAHMKKYVEQMASMFHGFRIDNAHGTPRHVAAYMIDAARLVRPHLLVQAELFTGDELMDEEYVAELGFNMLIREAMQAPDAHSLTDLIFRHGGRYPVGALDSAQKLVQHTLPVVLFDCTHDNETPTQKRTTEDSLSNGVLVAMSDCAIGSVRGYDELVPRNLSVVHEDRVYATTKNALLPTSTLLPVKSLLNALHIWMAKENYNELFVEYVYPEHHDHDALIVATRSHGTTGKSVVAICRPAFQSGVEDKHLPTVCVDGALEDVKLAVSMSLPRKAVVQFEKHRQFINGLNASFTVATGSAGEFCTMDVSAKETGAPYTKITFNPDLFTPGSAVVFSCAAIHPEHKALHSGRVHLPALWEMRRVDDIQHALASLSLTDWSTIMFCCEAEEKDRTSGASGNYGLPSGPLYYAGFASTYQRLKLCEKHNNMGDELLDNVRHGNWLADFLVRRLPKDTPELCVLAEWLEERFSVMNGVAVNMRPMLFHKLVTGVVDLFQTQIWSKMSPFVRDGPLIVKGLALTSVALYRHVSSAAQLYGDNAEMAKMFRGGGIPKASLAAGLTHFCTGFMRNWGRDTFIALRGLMLVTGRYEDARNIILSYAATVRHGLVPNLMDGGSRPRFNARDATWWFLQALQDYCVMAPEGLEILNVQVYRLFPYDRIGDHKLWQRKGREPAVHTKLADLVHEILCKHAGGISFREWFAGPSLDECMKSEGFNVEIRFDAASGLLLGGNTHNCGTWMDKMGSVPNLNRGTPATPRDGAPIEITGLLKSTLRWLVSVNETRPDIYPHTNVTDHKHKRTIIAYKDWDKRLQDNFERLYYVPKDALNDERYDVSAKLIHKRGIYKDVYGSALPFHDYQCRPNAFVAMAVAPELFTPRLAQSALTIMESGLVSTHQLGVKTLDPSDWAYRGNYDNSNASDDASIAGGFNYHQGPEWLWPLGYYLRARMEFFFPAPPGGEESNLSRMNRMVHTYLGKHLDHMLCSGAMGLPELTNENGAHCQFSCETQAWSSSTLLDALYDLDVRRREQM